VRAQRYSKRVMIHHSTFHTRKLDCCLIRDSILINSISHIRHRCFHIDYVNDVTKKTWYLYPLFLFPLTPSIHHAHASHITTLPSRRPITTTLHFPRKLINHDGRTITSVLLSQKVQQHKSARHYMSPTSLATICVSLKVRHVFLRY
jgi:hypothetical protein